jgi:hypothetical protein
MKSAYAKQNGLKEMTHEQLDEHWQTLSLYEVPAFKVLGFGTSYRVYMIAGLFNTFLAALTIHTNGWFMVTTILSNEASKSYWEYLFGQGMLWWVPYNSPKHVALLFWALSSVQFIVPLAKSLPPPFMKPLPDFLLTAKKRSETWKKTAVSEDEERWTLTYGEEYYPEIRYQTWWYLAFGPGDWEYTYHESLLHLAIASGMKITFAMTYYLFSSLQMNECLIAKRGFRLWVNKATGDVVNVEKHGREGAELKRKSFGWEVRAMEGVIMLFRSVTPRSIFILLAKCALQMNLQITLFGIRRLKEHKRATLMRDLISFSLDGPETLFLLSIPSMMFTVLNELSVVWTLFAKFVEVRNEVIEKVRSLGDDDYYVVAYNGGGHKIKEYKGKDVNWELWKCWYEFAKLAGVTLLALWMIGYALIKFFADSFFCHDGLWNWSWPIWNGCVYI